MYKTAIQCLTYQLTPNSMDSFNFWHGHMYLFLDFELQLLSFSCLLLLKISLTNGLLLESPFCWLLFLLQFRLQLSELFSTAFNSREKKTVKLLFITLLHFGVKYITKLSWQKTQLSHFSHAALWSPYICETPICTNGTM